MMPFRFLICAPFAFVALGFFALYYSVRNGRYGETWLIYPAALLFGLPSGITNVLWNIVFASFVFWEMPPWRNDSGEFSPMFTTRIKARLAAGRDDETTMWFVWAVNRYDPNHFKVAQYDL